VPVRVTNVAGVTRVSAGFVHVLAFGSTTGANIVVHPAEPQGYDVLSATLTFADVTSSGTSTLTRSGSGPTVPSGFVIGDPPTYYDITTTSGYTGTITVCLNYAGLTFSGGSPQLLHYQSGAFVDVTTSVDTTNEVVCGVVNALSPFTIAVRRTIDAQLSDLQALIRSYSLDQGTETSLIAKVQRSCGSLGAFVNAVSAQRGKKLNVAQAARLTADASRIRTQLGC
jgi:hypothetical protein